MIQLKPPAGLAALLLFLAAAGAQAQSVCSSDGPDCWSASSFNGYVGTSIELQPGTGGPWQAWLVLVETIPAGSEGSAVERNLVRNVLQLGWDRNTSRSEERPHRLIESRSMSIPEGAQAPRLRVVGWVEDARGRIRGIAQSRCQG